MMKISGRKIVSKIGYTVWGDEYFGENNGTARGKRNKTDKSIIKNANRKFRHDKSWKMAA